MEINVPDCAVEKNLKLKLGYIHKIKKENQKKGQGEKRIYIAKKNKDTSEDSLDEFFEYDKIKYFFFLKKDLLTYLTEAKEEYLNPIQDYEQDISKIYPELVKKINLLEVNKLKISFKKTYDSQKRYYLVLKNIDDEINSKNYDYFRNICLPKVSKLIFVKLEKLSNGERYIYIKPIFYLNKSINDFELEEEISKEDIVKLGKGRKHQVKFRNELLKIMPSCIITDVAEDRILQACHIKPFKLCEKDEEYDVHNGLIMTPTYHALFDLGFISFKNDGEILISPFISNLNQERLNLKKGRKYRLNKNSEKYLEFHRENRFNQIDESYLDL